MSNNMYEALNYNSEEEFNLPKPASKPASKPVVMDTMSLGNWADMCEEATNSIKKNAWEKPIKIKPNLIESTPGWTFVVAPKTETKSSKFKKEVIRCRRCRNCFETTIEEQVWFEQMGFKPRTVCKSCKQFEKQFGKQPKSGRRKAINLNQ